MSKALQRLFVALTLGVMYSSSHAFDKRLEVLRLGNMLKYTVLAERGDVWIASLKVENGNCGRSRHDGEDRARRLARYYDELVEAVAVKADTELIAERADRLHNTVNASKMYQKCWKTMVNRADLLANSADIALQIAQAGAGAK